MYDLLVDLGVIVFFIAPMVLIPFQLTADWARDRERKRIERGN